MYCKKCGKIIPDDSMFCQYCGERLSDVLPPKKLERMGLLSRFQSMSKGWQITLMSYVCWVFLWIILSLTEAFYDVDESVGYLVVFVIILPVLVLFVWYSITHLFHKKKNEEYDDSKSSVNRCFIKNNNTTEYSIYPLLTFSQRYGKMQVKVERDKSGNTVSYCIFTSPKGETTTVLFSDSTTQMNAADISFNKEKLFVIRMPSMDYKLIKL